MIEWDFWDNRGGQSSMAFQFGWINCDNSIFIPCKTKETLGIPGFLSRNNNKNNISQQWNNANYNNSGLIVEVNNPEYGFLSDLDDTPKIAEYILSKVDSLMNSVPTPELIREAEEEGERSGGDQDC
jgi:hypothetical protein